ncbi:hypothetical protein WA026_005765 [Henosepilachna vigintioctopunctata]|uniref:Uncharacterized protein n=1 Tax=Henosepilachna vigintioctopunctata TaxID=420089 RepID=A0AAW1U226_9CUCU
MKQENLTFVVHLTQVAAGAYWTPLIYGNQISNQNQIVQFFLRSIRYVDQNSAENRSPLNKTNSATESEFLECEMDFQETTVTHGDDGTSNSYFTQSLRYVKRCIVNYGKRRSIEEHLGND